MRFFFGQLVSGVYMPHVPMLTCPWKACFHCLTGIVRRSLLQHLVFIALVCETAYACQRETPNVTTCLES